MNKMNRYKFVVLFLLAMSLVMLSIAGINILIALYFYILRGGVEGGGFMEMFISTDIILLLLVIVVFSLNIVIIILSTDKYESG
jgi:hypothetical protein